MNKKQPTKPNDKAKEPRNLYEIVAKTADAELVSFFTDKEDALEYRRHMIRTGGKGENLGTPENPQGLPLKSLSRVRNLHL